MNANISVKSVGRSTPNTPPTAYNPSLIKLRFKSKRSGLNCDEFFGCQAFADFLHEAIDVFLGWGGGQIWAEIGC